MTPSAPTPWFPTCFRRYIEGLKSSMRTARIETDAGEAYIKALGNPEGPHQLACELVGTELARWFGLPTFDTAILIVRPQDEIPFHGGGRAAEGSAFVSRAVRGRTWSGDPAELDSVVNPEDVTRLVVFDNWVLNRDRHPPDLATRKPNYNNVYLAEEGLQAGGMRHPVEQATYTEYYPLAEEGLQTGGVRLLAMDHTHCFTHEPELTRRIADLDRVRDGRLYGLFPAFVPRLRAVVLEASRQRLEQLTPPIVRDILLKIPRAWDVPDEVVPLWQELICRRAAFVADNVIKQLQAVCP